MIQKKSIANQGFFATYKIQLLVIGLLVSLLYIRTTQFKFVGLDDNLLIQGNYKFIRNTANIKEAFVHDVFYNPSTPQASSGFYYRPLLTLSLILDAQFGGQSPNFYHFTNLLIHMVCCWLLFGFLIAFGYKPALAMLGGLLLAVHPMLSQAVGWIPGRNDSMLTLFILASLIYFKKFTLSGIRSDLFLHLLFFILAVFTKETAIFLPLISVSYLLIAENPQLTWKKKFQLQSTQRILTGYLLCGSLWFFLRRSVVSHTQADLSFTHLSQTFLDNFPIYFQLIQKMIFPFNLSIMSVAADTKFVLSFALIATMGVLLFLSKDKRVNILLWGFTWFNVFLLPSFLVPILTGFEHRAYLPMIGFLLIVFEIDAVKNLNFKKSVQLGSVITVVLLLFIVNINQTAAFANNFTFWEKASDNSPHSALAKLNYGAALAEQGNVHKALNVYREGLEINPAEPMIHNNIAVLFTKQERFDSARNEFEAEIRVNPNYSDAYYNLGVTFEKMGNTEEMLSNWEKAISINPNQQLARKALERYAKRNPGQ